MSQPRNGTPGDVEEIHWPSLVAAVSSISAVGIAIGLGLPLLSIILEKRGIPSTLIGLNTAMAGIAAMVAAPITTKLAHRYGVAQTMIWAVVISALSAISFYYAQDFWMWFPLRFAWIIISSMSLWASSRGGTTTRSTVPSGFSRILRSGISSSRG
jgi:predicted MFS family arabinose efflux permease